MRIAIRLLTATTFVLFVVAIGVAQYGVQDQAQTAHPVRYIPGLLEILVVLALLVLTMLLFTIASILGLVLALQVKEKPWAIAEGRARMSGFYLGVGLCCILLAQPLLYMALGFSWLLTAFGRILSMMSDGANTPFNWASVVVELVLAALPLAFAFGFLP